MTSFWRNNDVIITSWVQVEQAASLRSDWRFEMAGILQKALSNALKNIFCILIQTLTEVCAHCCVLKHVRIDSCDGLVSSRRQATTWTNESSVHCRTHRFINPQYATSTVARPRIWYFHNIPIMLKDNTILDMYMTICSSQKFVGIPFNSKPHNVPYWCFSQ